MEIVILKESDKKDWITLASISDNRSQEWAEQKLSSYTDAKKKKVILVCKEDGKFIGLAGLKAEDINENVEEKLNEEYIILTWIALIPEARGKGIGSKLLLESEKYCKKWRKRGIWLGCRDKVIPFYEKNGYKKAGTFLNDRNKQENLMLKNIS